MKTTSKDLGLALAVAALGGVAILSAVRAHWSPPDLDPGVEGCLTTGLVAFVMALLHPLRYRGVVALCAPVIAAEYVVLRYAAGSATSAGMIGIQLALMGFVGVVKAFHEPSLGVLDEAAVAGGMVVLASSLASSSDGAESRSVI